MDPVVTTDQPLPTDKGFVGSPTDGHIQGLEILQNMKEVRIKQQRPGCLECKQAISNMNTYSVSRKFFLPDFEFQKTLIFLKCYNVGNMLTSTKFWTRIRNKYFYSKRNQTVYHDTVVIIFGLWKAVFRYNVNKHIF